MPNEVFYRKGIFGNFFFGGGGDFASSKREFPVALTNTTLSVTHSYCGLYKSKVGADKRVVRGSQGGMFRIAHFRAQVSL